MVTDGLIEETEATEATETEEIDGTEEMMTGEWDIQIK